mmetsp:Transcript_15801/g.21386  ORF Transcript_15801/g.21386 Transcript_15801/m.21386 type:complete len:118 (+) Transcript_15801:648-1001(+)
MVSLALFLHKAPEAAGYGTYIVHLQSELCAKVSYIAAYSFSSPLSAFVTFSVFSAQSVSSIDDPLKKEKLNWWMGFTLLIAIGTLTYITLMHILPEVFLADDHDDHDHFGHHDEEET